MRVAIIVGSTRSTRKSKKVADWVLAGAGDYQHDHTKRWAALIDGARR